jgi:hypothetical protein
MGALYAFPRCPTQLAPDRMKITRDDMFEPLLEALPSFRPQREKFIEDWTPKPGEYSDLKPGEYPNYMLLGDLAAHLCDLLQNGQCEDIVKALAVAERWITEGEHYVHEGCIVGLLEDLKGYCHRRKIPEESFLALMGPEGKYWWAKLNGFWKKTDLLIDDRVPPAKTGKGTLKP